MYEAIEINPWFTFEPDEPFDPQAVTPGSIDYRVVDQDEWWVNVRGEPFRLNEMSKDYLRSVYNFMQPKAEEFHFWAVMRTINGIITDLQNGVDNADVLQYQLTGTTIANMEHTEWLNSTPLMRKIQQLINS